MKPIIPTALANRDGENEDPDAADLEPARQRRLVAEFEQCEWAQRRKDQECGEGETRQQVEHAAPSALEERSGLPDEQVCEVVVIVQDGERGEASAIEADDQTCHDQRGRGETLPAGDEEDRKATQAAAGERDRLLPPFQQFGQPERRGNQREACAGRDAERAGLRKRVAQDHLEDAARKTQRRAAKQSHHRARREAVGDQQVVDRRVLRLEGRSKPMRWRRLTQQQDRRVRRGEREERQDQHPRIRMESRP
ncbi:hypothetical protein NWE53_15995 [Bosea sp. NBC_00550]|nr:hypothetical protein [Bosea sp. NBC_00550]UZF90639.1 hypothetical protein NWE53_15995 [Bosea sp. NBC_00550]